MIISEKNYVEHHGVKGMKWGVRRTRKVQKVLDRRSRVASGTASGKDRLLEANRGVFTQKGANRQLQRGANNQAKMAAGKMRVSKQLLRASGVRMSELNFHKQGDAHAKRDAGQKAALAVVGAVLIANGARTLSSLS